MGFAIIYISLQPYNDRPFHKFASENIFEPLVLLVLSMSFILLRFSAFESSMSYTAAYAWIVIVVNSCILLLLMGIIFYRLVVSRNGKLCWCSFVNGRDGRSGENEERTNLLSVNSRHPEGHSVNNMD